MNFDMQVFHAATFYLLFGSLALATFVVVERLIFYTATLKDARKLETVLSHDVQSVSELPADLVGRNSLAAEAVRKMLSTKALMTRQSDVEDYAESLYISLKGRLNRHIWVLDTVVTAAPLLGLLGTILGIIDTFAALSNSGVSDPAAVSRGIGTALYATALGISVALYALFFNNLFQTRIDGINDHLKILLLRAGIGESRGSKGVQAELAGRQAGAMQVGVANAH